MSRPLCALPPVKIASPGGPVLRLPGVIVGFMDAEEWEREKHNYVQIQPAQMGLKANGTQGDK